MADQKISELTALTGANVADDDAIAIVDTSATETKKIVFSELKNALDTATGFVRITGDTMTGALNVQSTITSDGLTVDGDATFGNGSVELFQLSGGATNSILTIRDNNRFKIQSGTEDSEVDRFVIENNGDISFYEDTGTTAKFFWDAAAESLGIGQIQTSHRLNLGDNSGDESLIFTVPANGLAKFHTNRDSAEFTWNQPSGELMRIDSSGNVGIGESDPQELLHISGGGAPGIRLQDTTNAGTYALIDTGNNGQLRLKADVGQGIASSFISFEVDASEAMRIDNSGVLFVGKASDDNTENGLVVNGNGFTKIVRTSATANVNSVLQLNRLSSDGDIAVFQTDGTTVGSIGVANGQAALTIGNADTGLSFQGNQNDAIFPYNVSTNALRDNAISLGYSSSRFKDLYLSGTAYVSGTGVVGRFGNTTANNYVEVIRTTTSPSYINIGATSSAASIAGGPALKFSITDASGSGASEAMLIDSSGNLLVGKTVSTYTTDGVALQPNGSSNFSRSTGAASNAVVAVNRNTSDGTLVTYSKDGSTVGSIGTSSFDLTVGNDDVGFKFHNASNMIIPWNLATNGGADNTTNLGDSSNRFKDLYLSGDTFVGEPSTIGAGEAGVTVRGLGQVRVGRAGTASVTLVSFNNGNGEVGTIVTSGSATAYNTSSDYRLKTDAQPMTGATDRLKQLNPVNFEWIADGTRVDGFLAHEAQAVVPEAVTGAKDAMRDEEYEVTPAVLDDDGNVVTEAVMGTRSVPDYQGIDQSKLVPLLVATIKELEARITALENA